MINLHALYVLFLYLSIMSGMVTADVQQKGYLQIKQDGVVTTSGQNMDNADRLSPIHGCQNVNEQKTMATSATGSTIVYFGYGSNLWLDQMERRCPNSTYLGVALLHDFRWMIFSRGYANIVALATERHDVVYGLVYRLTQSDEARLDRNEDVPWAYTKEMLQCDFWPANGTTWTNTSVTAPERRPMLVYINRNDTVDAAPKEEYVERMNMGIADAIAMGVPQEYIKKYLRPFIPASRFDKNKGYTHQRQALSADLKQ